MKLYICLAALIPLMSLAQVLDQASCTSMDIKNSNQKIKKNVPLLNHFSKPRNQDSIGWCYGFSAADLLSAELGVPVSAFHASILYNKKIAKSLISKMIHFNDAFDQVYEGGFTKDAIAEIVKAGKICKESDLPFDKKHPEQTLTLIKTLESIKNSHKDHELTCSLLQSPVKKNDLNTDIDQVAESLLKENLNKTLDLISLEHCKDKMISIPSMKVKKESVPSLKDKIKTKKFLTTINGLLDSGKPIEVSYEIGHIAIEGATGHHSSLVVGRRFKNGKCQYQIRNSWGQTCHAYNLNTVSCDAKSGSYWVNDEVFVNMSKDISYIAK